MPDGKGDPEKNGKEQKKEKKVVIKKITPLSVQQKKDTFQRFEDGINQQNKVFRRSLKITVTNQDKTNKVVKIVPIQEEIECITYHIYSDTEGKIEKYTPKEIDKGYEKKCQYIVYQNDSSVYSCILEKNEYDLFPFPENGYNWGRYGGRDKGGDNWIEEKTCAALLGFFYSLPKNNFNETLYYNDISANDKRNIGHKTHRGGQDVDIRYPGSHNGSQVLWREAMKKYKDEKEFVSVLENILYVSTLWGFNTNYAYKSNIKYTKGTATSVHQDHFHIGLR